MGGEGGDGGGDGGDGGSGGGGGGEGGVLHGRGGRPVVPSYHVREDAHVPSLGRLTGKDDVRAALHPRLHGPHAAGDDVRILVRRRSYGTNVSVLRRIDGADDLLRVGARVGVGLVLGQGLD